MTCICTYLLFIHVYVYQNILQKALLAQNLVHSTIKTSLSEYEGGILSILCMDFLFVFL